MKIHERGFGEIKGFEFRKYFKASYGFYYAPKGMNSFYFGFIPTFGLILGLVVGWFYVYGMFCGLNWEDIAVGGKGLSWDGFGSKWRVLELPRSSLACSYVALYPFKPPILDDHIFLVRTPICTFLDSKESPLSLKYDHMIKDGIWWSYL